MPTSESKADMFKFLRKQKLMRQHSSCPLPTLALSTRHGHQGHRTSVFPVLALCSDKKAQKHRDSEHRQDRVGTLTLFEQFLSELSPDGAFCM